MSYNCINIKLPYFQVANFVDDPKIDCNSEDIELERHEKSEKSIIVSLLLNLHSEHLHLSFFHHIDYNSCTNQHNINDQT